MTRDMLARCLRGIALASALLAVPSRALAQADECLIGFRDNQGSLDDGTTLCAVASRRLCTFDLALCLNQPGCSPATFKRTIHAKGHCGSVGRLHVQASGSSSPCGPSAGIKVRTRKNGKKEGNCTVRVAVHSASRKDLDKLSLVCMPQGSQCPVTCAPIVSGQPIDGTYQTLTLPATDPVAIKICTPQTMNSFQPCSSDADCGGTSGGCAQTPWVDAGGFVEPTPVNAKTVFTVAAASPPTCEHTACISCGNPDAVCAGIPGCADQASGCIKSTCCDQPGFTLPPLIVAPGALNICTRVDQIQCGTGVINTSDPQTGDNEVTKMGDTSDPGADCCYNGHPASECPGGVNTNDDPAAKPCNTQATGAGGDTAGKILRTVGNGTPDARGIQIRLRTPGLSTAWFNDNEGCPTPPCTTGHCNGGTGSKACATDADCNATFDSGENLASQLILNTEPTTAGATAAFVDMNGDGCASSGSNFAGTLTSRGPYTIGPPAVLPLPYGGSGYRSAAAGLVFSGGLLHDIGFIAITPTGAPAVVTPAQSCTCSTTPGCPE